MSMLKSNGSVLTAVGALGGLMLSGLLASPVAAASLEVIANSLESPRGLAFSPVGVLYVTEAGRGGDGACIQSGSGSEVCYGATGGVTRIWKGEQQRIASGLPSLALPDGSEATGPHDIVFNQIGSAQIVIGLGASPSERDTLGEVGKSFGTLISAFTDKRARTVGDVVVYEETSNPDGGELDTNPYGVAIQSGKRAIADAGGNSLLSMDTVGNISTLAVFPERLVDAPPFLGLPPGTQIPMESVPNSVAIGPDGAYYVGELTGFPFPVGAARVYRVVPGAAPEVLVEGFTNIIDIAFATDGSLYVLEYAKNSLLSGDPTGALTRISPDGSRTLIVSEGLIAPTGVAIASTGEIYVSNNSATVGEGQVVRVVP